MTSGCVAASVEAARRSASSATSSLMFTRWRERGVGEVHQTLVEAGIHLRRLGERHRRAGEGVLPQHGLDAGDEGDLGVADTVLGEAHPVVAVGPVGLEVDRPLELGRGVLDSATARPGRPAGARGSRACRWLIALLRSALACSISRCSSASNPTESTVAAEGVAERARARARWAGDCAATGAAHRSRPSATTSRLEADDGPLVAESSDRGVVRRRTWRQYAGLWRGVPSAASSLRTHRRAHGGGVGSDPPRRRPGAPRPTLGRLRPPRSRSRKNSADPVQHGLGVEPAAPGASGAPPPAPARS